MENIVTYGIIYLLVFRLAVLLLGGLCIFFGYRLFYIRWQQAGGTAADQGGEVHGKIGGSELTIKSAAPGIFFAAFGAVIVIAVLIGSQPNVTYDDKQSSPQAGGQSRAAQDLTQKTISMRSLPPRSSVQSDAGAADYSRVLSNLSESIEQLRNAVSRVPENPDYHDLLARLLFALGEPAKAAAEQRLAVENVDEARTADFQSRLHLYQQAAR